MAADSISVLDGNTFVVSNRQGDIEGGPGDDAGLFLIDTRFLSRWVLTVDGRRPNLLSVDRLKYFRTQFFGALSTGTIYVDSHLSVTRRRSITQGFHEDIVLQNHGHEPMDVELRIEVDADFADLFEVKDKLPKKGEYYRRHEDGRYVLGYRREHFVRETWITTSQPAELGEGTLQWRVHLPAHGDWKTCANVQAVVEPERALQTPGARADHGDDLRPELDTSLQTLIASAPRLETSWSPLERTYHRSLVDLGALRFRSRLIPDQAMPAAGLPWFMAMFGRDSILTSLQALPFIPELAATTLRVLGALQARTDEAFRDAEPGKILHELRLGEMTAFEERPHSPYYGAADSTPLFLVLLDEYERWSGDRPLVASLQREARAAIKWIDEYGDRDGDGYIEYERRNPETGLENQCWKDSWDSIAFSDGTLAPLPRATCEIQGYVYDAKKRTARLSRLVWGDREWADRLEREAEALKDRFNHDYWISDRKFFALALDGQKRKVDSLTSNIGHLLWSGIVEDEKAADCVRHLMGPELYSGWGVRTMGSAEGSYNPIGYHVGTVWPHDNSFVAWGLRRYGYREEAARLARDIFEAAECFDYRLPEAFAGYERQATRFPVEYPTACSPQAWASGAPLLLIRTLLGLEADGEHLIVDPAIPQPIEELELLDIPGRWGRMDAFGRARIDLPA
ncbi:MAG TPA: glycogen debranching N-terminal domain-containing protein [Gemmatimonadales bacterium]|nr:glycogen debranching N-terminal domain-containing protein [Gemmatimonadales bacterium]